MPEQIPPRPLPFFFIGRAIASARIQKFQDTKHALLTTNIGKPETKSIWYSFQHIEEMYKELIHLNADGLRIYLGTYEEGHPDFANQLCVIMVPTFLNTSMKHQDIILGELSNFSERFSASSFDNSKEIADLSEAYKEFNYGSPCPPVCFEGEFSYP